MIVEENGKTYDVDEQTGKVTLASTTTEPLTDDVDFDGDFHTGARVEVDGESGTIIAITASFYGNAYGVRFDDGGIDEFIESQLKHSSLEKVAYASPIDEVISRFDSYQQLPHYTNAEIDAKETEARYLNLRASSLVTDSKLVLSDQNQLGKVVLVTGNDLIDLKELREQSEESQAYRNKFNRYKIADEISGYGAGLGLKGDASWLGDALEGMEVVETTDADLAVRAAELVAAFDKKQLEDDEFMQVAISYQAENLQIDSKAQADKFASFVSRARAERIKELPAESAEKTASADDLDNFDTAALFL